MQSGAELLADDDAGYAWGPVVENRPATREAPELKVVVFNARGGRHLREVIRLFERPPLKDPDVILLCEADWGLRRSNGCKMAADLAEALRMSFAYVGEFGIRRTGVVKPHAFMGNALLSSRPLAEIKASPLPAGVLRWHVRRMGAPAGLSAKIAVNGMPIALGVVHLNSRWNPAGRETQMSAYLSEFPREGAAIIGGDLNTTTVDLRNSRSILKMMPRLLLTPWRFHHPERWEPLFERLRDAGFNTREANPRGRPTFTYSRLIPPWMRPKLDWIALRRLRPEPGSVAVVPPRSGLLGRRLSDHDFVTCVIRV